MAKTDTSEDLRGLSANDLEGLATATERELWEIRRKRETEAFTNTALIGRTRKKLARIKTILAEKRRAESEVAS